MAELTRWSAILPLIALTGCAAFGEPRPREVKGEDPDQVARRFERLVNRKAWEETGAVQWTFAGKNRHLWDRRRGLVRVEWSEHLVLLALESRRGLACSAGEPAEADDLRELVADAYARWVNDAFWLNPLAKLFDRGVKRSVAIDDEGTRGLLVSYTQGGLTPGDAFFWLTDQRGVPMRWKMWTSNLPIAGLSATWERWIELETGAKISTLHQIGPFDLELSGVAGARTLSGLTDAKPFAPLVGEAVLDCQALQEARRPQ